MTDSEAAAETLRSRGVTESIPLAVILGSGLGSLAESLDEAVSVPYADLPGFPASGVSSHVGEFVAGSLDGHPIAVLRGRAHYYERGDAAAMATPLETLARLGCNTLIVTNAAGSLHTEWHPGSLALIADHINFSGTNPLIGATGDDRFVPLPEAYDRRLRARMRRAAASAAIPSLREGVYMWFSGPSFETPAEVRAAKLLGADLVGMSTVPEVILARRLGLRVAAISVVTNFGTGIAGGNPSHEETKAVAATGGSLALKRLIRAFLRTPDVAA